jgi:hypothetical protein
MYFFFFLLHLKKKVLLMHWIKLEEPRRKDRILFTFSSAVDKLHDCFCLNRAVAWLWFMNGRTLLIRDLRPN